MKRLAAIGVAVAGLGLFGTGLVGMAEVDGRLAGATDRPAVRELDVRQEIRGPDDCPGREHREETPLRDELSL